MIRFAILDRVRALVLDHGAILLHARVDREGMLLSIIIIGGHPLLSLAGVSCAPTRRSVSFCGGAQGLHITEFHPMPRTFPSFRVGNRYSRYFTHGEAT